MKKFIKTVVFLSILAFSGASLAKDDARAEAERLLTAVNMEASANALVENLLNRELAANPQFKPFEDLVRAYLEKQAGYARLKNDLIDIYSAEFTAAELREIAAFYRTPTGRKALSAMPGILNKGAAMSVARVEANVSELEASINAKAVQLREQHRAQAGNHALKTTAAQPDASKASDAKAGVDSQKKTGGD